MKLSRAIRLLTAIVCVSTLLSTPAQAATQTWKTLTPAQQEALAPIAQEWDKLPQKQQKRLIATAKRYPKLNPDQKQRFQTRLSDWVKLSQEQRNKAREKHKVISRLPPGKREEVKRKVLQEEAAKIAVTPTSGVDSAVK